MTVVSKSRKGLFQSQKAPPMFYISFMPSKANFDASKCENNVDGGKCETTNVFCIIESDSKSISFLLRRDEKAKLFLCACLSELQTIQSCLKLFRFHSSVR